MTEREDLCGKQGLVTDKSLAMAEGLGSFLQHLGEGGEGPAQRGSGTRVPALPAQCDPFRLVPGLVNAFGLVLWVDGNVSSHGPNGGHN